MYINIHNENIAWILSSTYIESYLKSEDVVHYIGRYIIAPDYNT